jgi:putative transposase
VVDVIYKTYKFRLLPTETQKVLLDKHFGCVRFVYNYFLTYKQQEYLKNKKTPNLNACSKGLTALRKELPWLKETASTAQVQALHDLENAYQRFFKKKCNFPKYKSKRHIKQSFYTYQSIKIKPNNYIQITKFESGIKFIRHREIVGDIYEAIVTKSSTNKYYISIGCKIVKKSLPKTNKCIGLDLGIKDFAVSSDGQRFTIPKYQKLYAKRLKQKQKALSRKKIGSNRRQKAKIAAAKIYEKIANSRQDMQHKLSFSLVKNYDVIAIENLDVSKMRRDKLYSKALSDVAWSSFVSKLKYKAEWYGKELVLIDRFYPSTKTCCVCDYINRDMTVKERSWVCKRCNTKHDRDVNAAKNILRQALISKSSGTDDYRRGVTIRPNDISETFEGRNGETSKKRSVTALKPKVLL